MEKKHASNSRSSRSSSTAAAAPAAEVVGGPLWDHNNDDPRHPCAAAAAAAAVEPLLLSWLDDDNNNALGNARMRLPPLRRRGLLILPTTNNHSNNDCSCSFTCWDTATGTRVAEWPLASDNNNSTRMDDDDRNEEDGHPTSGDRSKISMMRMGSMRLHPDGRHIWVLGYSCPPLGSDAAAVAAGTATTTRTPVVPVVLLQVFAVAHLQQALTAARGDRHSGTARRRILLHPVAQRRWTLPGTTTSSTTLWDINRMNLVVQQQKQQATTKFPEKGVEFGNSTTTAVVRSNTVLYAIVVRTAESSAETGTTSKRKHHQAQIVRMIVEDSADNNNNYNHPNYDDDDDDENDNTAAIVDWSHRMQVLDTHPYYERDQNHLFLRACTTTTTSVTNSNPDVLVFANSSKLRVLLCRRGVETMVNEASATGATKSSDKDDDDDNSSRHSNTLNTTTSVGAAVRAVDLESLLCLERGGSGRITACHVLPNETDLVVGDWEGAIYVLYQALARCIEYCEGPHYRPPHTVTAARPGHEPRVFPPHHPCNSNDNNNNNNNPSIIVRKLHWHVHPVQALTSDATGRFLYSGGEESVLCAWSLDRASTVNQPTQMLPRTALQGIQQIIVCESSDGDEEGRMEDLVVYTGDNVLQRLDPVHNWRRVWKVQGLATTNIGKNKYINTPPPCMMSRGGQDDDNVVALWNLPGAPGYLHFYHVQQQRCVQTLEVVPWNRVSHAHRRRRRGNRHDPGILATTFPTVTHAAFSDQSLLTVDEVPTENGALGAAQPPPPRRRVSNSNSCSGSLVTTLRFWQTDPNQPNGYKLVAAMPHPHGRCHRVSGLVLHQQFAATVSAQERAIRLWHKKEQPHEHSSSVSSPHHHHDDFLWTCRCKVTVPSGYANCMIGQQQESTELSFSSDASVLAVAFGSHVTLWDHREEVTLLGALRHDRPTENISRMKFLSSTHLVDMVLTQSTTAVTLQSPYGSAGGSAGWNWLVEDDNLQISNVEFLPESEVVAIVLQQNSTTTTCDVQSRIVLVDAITGACQLRLSPISGHVVALTSLPSRGGIGARSTEASLLYALTSRGQMVCFKEKSDPDDNDSIGKTNAPRLKATERAVPTLPLLPATATKVSGRKRSMSVLQLDDLQVASSTKRGLFSLRNFFGPATDVGGDGTTELPLLRGAFARSFVARHLQQPQEE